jgi:hypothetical protein
METLNKLLKMIDKRYENPAEIKDKNKRAEVEAFNRLADNLKDIPSILYFNPYIPPQSFSPEIKPDILWLYPRGGLLIVEVKAWDKEFVENMQVINGRLVWRYNSYENPLKEANRFKENLMSYIKRKRRNGKLPCPLEYVVYFPNMSRKEYRELKNQEFKNLVSEEACIFRNDRRVAERLMRRLALHSMEIDEKEVFSLRGILFPGLRVAKFESGIKEEEVPLMDVFQEGLLYRYSKGYRILRGTAGSGKTVVLIGKAVQEKFVHREKKVLFVTYANSLANEIKAGIRRILEAEEIKDLNLNDFKITTVDSLVVSLLKKVLRGAPDFGEEEILNARKQLAELLQKRPETLSEEDRYDVILCDESQDFTPEVFPILKALLKKEGLLIFGVDETQRIYDKTDWKWIDVGIKASGGNVHILRKSYRNPGKVFSLAVEFLKRDTTLMKELKELDSVVAQGNVTAVRKDAGIVEFYELDNEFVGVAEIVERLIKEEGVNYGDIFILTAFKNHVEKFFNAISKRLPKDKIYSFSSESDKENKFVPNDKLVIMPYKSSKGLERQVVVVTGVGNLPYESSRYVKDKRRDRRTLYVAMTRAQKRLIITSYKGKDNGFAKEIKELIKRFNH